MNGPLPLLPLLFGVLGFAAAAQAGGGMFQLTSTAFADNTLMPVRHTGDGPDLAPALAWTEPPAGTKSFSLIVDDPDAPDPRAPRMTWVHWVLYNLPATLRALPEGTRPGAIPGASDGLNDSKTTGYSGPMPPIGTHRYFFKLYALDTVLPVPPAPVTKPQLLKLMDGHILAQTQLLGLYHRPGR